jgi:hypothetical protein
MGRYVCRALALLLALFMRPTPVPGPAATSTPVEPAADERWYEPLADDFRPHYDRDVGNGGEQTWEQYWGWVESFYQGNFFTKGWSGRAKWLLEGVASDVERNQLRAKLNALGRDICAEWAKDYDRRKVGTADLLTWGKMMEKARADDDGRGVEIHRALDAIRDHYLRKVAGRSSG